MRFLCLAAIVLCLCGSTRAARKPDVQVLECVARRGSTGKIAVDGRIKITGSKPVKGLILIFDFISSEGETLTSQNIQAGEDVLDPGEESSFHGETMNPPGAVRYRLRAMLSDDRELRLGNAGPFPIE